MTDFLPDPNAATRCAPASPLLAAISVAEDRFHEAQVAFDEVRRLANEADDWRLAVASARIAAAAEARYF
jgi:cytochrome c-type biogenesis protein CcmH/NrfG